MGLSKAGNAADSFSKGPPCVFRTDALNEESRAGPPQENPPRGLHADSAFEATARMGANTTIRNIN